MAKITQKAVKESLLEQLARAGKTVEFYADLINDYMSLWDIKTKLIRDVKERGVVYEDYSSVGIKMMKNNPSTKELIMTNRQMLTVLEKLGLTTAQIDGGEDDDL